MADIVYTRTTWQNDPSTATPIDATHLNNAEAGIVAVTAQANTALTTATAAQTTGNAAVPASTATTKGDIFVATAAGTITRLPVGTDGQVLTADSTQTSGLKYATPAAGGGSSGLPSWGSTTGTFDPLRSFYRSTNSDCLGTWRAARGKAKAGNGYAHILVIGDSHADGKMDDTLSGGTSPNGLAWQLNTWAEVLKSRLVNAGIPDGGTGWVKFGGLLNPSDPRWTTSGATAFTGRTGQTLFSWGNNTATGMIATLTPTSAISDGTAVDVLLKNTGKPWTLAAQTTAGGAVSSVTTTRDGTSTLTVQSSTGTGIGKLVATTLTGTGGNWNLGAGQIRRASGLLVSNFAISNSYASHNNTTYWGWDEDTSAGGGFFDYEGGQAAALTPTPDLVICQLGGNDDLLGASDATITAALTTIFARWPNASKMLVLNWGLDNTNRHNMFNAYYTLADTLGISVFDTLHQFGDSVGVMGPRGLYNAGTSYIHPNESAHAQLGGALADLLLA